MPLGLLVLERYGAAAHTAFMSLFETTRRRRVRVLFVCYANACRSRMAEAFANAYAPNLVEAASAGLAPAEHVSRRTVAVMAEKNIYLDERAPRPLADLDLDSFDLIVNLSGRSLPPTATRVLPVPLPDPARGDVNLHRQVRDSVERVVRTLLVKLHSAREMAA
jgi:protein-tyrosine-phosphatase